MSEAIDCVVAGHICLDVTPEFRTGGSSVAEIFRPGSLIQVGSATISTGGPVSNTGFPLRRLGNTVKLMGKCGDDMWGRALIEKIREEAPGAEEGMQVVPGEESSYTVVVSPPGIDRIFLHCPGANDTFGAENIDLDTIGQARLVHFGYPPLMARTYADGGAELVKIFQAIKDSGATASLDMAYPDPSGPAAEVDWRALLGKTLPHVDIFTPSVEELLLVLRRETFDELTRRAGGGEMLPLITGEILADLADECLQAGAAVVLIKCGYLGMYVRTAGADRLAEAGRGQPEDVAPWADRELFEPSYAVEQIVSATGAGDCAIAGFLTAFLRGEPLDEAMRYACAVGGQNLAAADSISGVQTWQATTRHIRTRPLKNDLDVDLPAFQFDPEQHHYVGPRDKQSARQ
ncbi:MAG: carbohydrate kinase family protein [Planctomycetota bacterium]